MMKLGRLSWFLLAALFLLAAFQPSEPINDCKTFIGRNGVGTYYALCSEDACKDCGEFLGTCTMYDKLIDPFWGFDAASCYCDDGNHPPWVQSQCSAWLIISPAGIVTFDCHQTCDCPPPAGGPALVCASALLVPPAPPWPPPLGGAPINYCVCQ